MHDERVQKNNPLFELNSPESVGFHQIQPLSETVLVVDLERSVKTDSQMLTFRIMTPELFWSKRSLRLLLEQVLFLY